jgi:hypothetical protein
MLAAPDMGARLLRNNVGVMQDTRGNYVHYGVAGNGGSDLIGWVQVTITPEMVGRTVAVFAAVETKREDWRAPGPAAKGKDAERWLKQCIWLAAVTSAGGISCVAKSIKDVAQAIEAFRRGR